MTREMMLDKMVNRYGFENDWVIWFAKEAEQCETDKEAEWLMQYAESQIELEMILEDEEGL